MTKTYWIKKKIENEDGKDIKEDEERKMDDSEKILFDMDGGRQDRGWN